MPFCDVIRIDRWGGARAWIASHLPEGRFSRIFVKPNWVRHADDPAFPIGALVTSPGLIEAVVDACIEKYPAAERITVGDVPLQSCEWDRLREQAGIARLEVKHREGRGPVVEWRDLRRERFVLRDGFLEPAAETAPGDPRGYREVILDESSFLDPVSDDVSRFRVSDYDPGETTSSHRRGSHRYLMCGSALDSDLFINLPKMKTHQKTGITGALKNIVGLVGAKSCLVHHRMGRPAAGGDEFPADGSAWVQAQTRLRERLQKRSRLLFAAGRAAWRVIRRGAGIETRGTPENLGRRMYVGAGSWYGNDTIWRMIYDLNRIIRYAPPGGGRLASAPQRRYVAFLDGVVAGEGNGPLQPLPVDARVGMASDDPFRMDLAMAALMGFDPARIPLFANMALFGDAEWGAFDLREAVFTVEGKPCAGVAGVRAIKAFVPPPGWRGHIERRDG